MLQNIIFFWLVWSGSALEDLIWQKMQQRDKVGVFCFPQIYGHHWNHSEGEDEQYGDQMVLPTSIRLCPAWTAHCFTTAMFLSVKQFVGWEVSPASRLIQAYWTRYQPPLTSSDCKRLPIGPSVLKLWCLHEAFLFWSLEHFTAEADMVHYINSSHSAKRLWLAWYIICWAKSNAQTQ